MQQAAGRRVVDAVEVDLPAELGLLSSLEGFLDIGGLCGIVGADLGDLAALVGSQFQNVLFAWCEKEESAMELTFDLTESRRLGGSQHCQDSAVAGIQVAGESLQSHGGNDGVKQSDSGKDPYFGPALPTDDIDARALGGGQPEIFTDLRLIQKNGHERDAVRGGNIGGRS